MYSIQGWHPGKILNYLNVDIDQILTYVYVSTVRLSCGWGRKRLPEKTLIALGKEMLSVTR